VDQLVPHSERFPATGDRRGPIFMGVELSWPLPQLPQRP
jgi:hypothetical protein